MQNSFYLLISISLNFPLQIQTATAHYYMGEQEIDGVLCEGILLSWGTTAPQKSIDQYLVWINKESKLIVKLEYTIRDSYKFLTGATSYTQYKDF